MVTRQDEVVGKRRTGPLAWTIFGIVILGFVAGLALDVLGEMGKAAPDWAAVAQEQSFLFAMLSFPAVGLLIATRRPENSVGWVMLAIGVMWQCGGAASSYTRYGLVARPDSLPGVDVVAALVSGGWAPAIGLIGFLILLFPDGRLPSARWKPLAWLFGTVLGYVTVLIPLTPGTLAETAGDPSFADIPNPLGIEGLESEIFFAPLALIPLCLLGCAYSVIRRYRRAGTRERLQLKWLSAGAATTAVLYLVAMIFSLTRPGSWFASDAAWLTVLQNLAVYSFALIAIAAGAAILRHRLYDIDVIINRALVYGALTAGLALLYFGGVLAIGAIVRPVSGRADNGIAVAMSTLAVAALFRPLRGRIQSFIDRRFYRQKYDAQRTLAGLATRLRDEIDLESLNEELVEVVIKTMRPAHVSLWLRPVP